MSREYCKRLQGRDKLATFVPCSLQQQPNCIGTNNPHERSVHGSLNSFFLSAYILSSKLQSLLPFSFLFLSFFFPFLTYCIFVQHPSPEMRPEKHTVFSHSHLPVSIYHLNSCTIFSLSTTYFLSQLLSHNYSLKTHINFSG